MNLKKISSLLICVFPTLVFGDCTCDSEVVDHKNGEALKLKIGAIASILFSGVVGVSLPLLGRKIPTLRPENDIFFIVKAFAAGVILATGFIHILPDAFKHLTSPCLDENPWGKFPFTGFAAMMSAIFTLMIDSFATGYYKRLHSSTAANKQVIADDETTAEDHHGHVHVHTHATHGHAHGSASSQSNTSDLIRHRIIAQVRLIYLLIIIWMKLEDNLMSFWFIFFIRIFCIYAGPGIGYRSSFSYNWDLIRSFSNHRNNKVPYGCPIFPSIF